MIGVLVPHSTEWEYLDANPRQHCQVIAISQGHVIFPGDLDQSELHNHLYYHGLEEITEYHDFYHVLWIGWEGNVAVRRGLGIVLQAAWDSLETETANIHLG